MTCDRDRMLRSIGHVVENAVKLAPAGSTVTLAVGLQGSDVCFAVTDRGPGLTPQVRRNLYDRHWHAKRASRVGAGFGLAVTRGFVRHAQHAFGTTELMTLEMANRAIASVDANRSRIGHLVEAYFMADSFACGTVQ